MIFMFWTSFHTSPLKVESDAYLPENHPRLPVYDTDDDEATGGVLVRCHVELIDQDAELD